MRIAQRFNVGGPESIMFSVPKGRLSSIPQIPFIKRDSVPNLEEVLSHSPPLRPEKASAPGAMVGLKSQRCYNLEDGCGQFRSASQAGNASRTGGRNLLRLMNPTISVSQT
jgi:hypothetical protein